MSSLGLDPETAHRCSRPPRRKDNQELWREKANRQSHTRRGQSLRYRLDRWPPLQANTPKLPVLHSPYSLIVPPVSDVRSVILDGHVISSRHEGGVAQVGSIYPFLFSLYVNDMPSPSHHVELALYADDTAVIATSRKPTLLVSYLESFIKNPSTVIERMENRHKCFQEQPDNIHVCRTAIHPAPTSNTLRGTNPMGRN